MQTYMIFLQIPRVNPRFAETIHLLFNTLCGQLTQAQFLITNLKALIILLNF